MTGRFEARDKRTKCPKCGSIRIARYLYGMPMMSEQLQADLDTGRIVIGGCEITGDDPAWKCLECETEIYRK
jgi:predicted RNA-binding Zn-ribbon protein involved in translation (DUF1610 family)